MAGAVSLRPPWRRRLRRVSGAPARLVARPHRHAPSGRTPPSPLPPRLPIPPPRKRRNSDNNTEPCRIAGGPVSGGAHRLCRPVRGIECGRVIGIRRSVRPARGGEGAGFTLRAQRQSRAILQREITLPRHSPRDAPRRPSCSIRRARDSPCPARARRSRPTDATMTSPLFAFHRNRNARRREE